MADKPPHWPANVEPLVLEEFEKLGRDANNRLFWDGKHLVTRNQYIFTGPQAALAVLAAIASLATIITGLNNASVFLCARGIAWLGCPAPAPPAIVYLMPQPAPTTAHQPPPGKP
jgi:hypothetical protein